MAMNFNSSNSNPFGHNIYEDTIDTHFYSLNQNFGLNHLSDSSLLGSQLLRVSNRSPFGLGQLGLSQHVTEFRRAYVTPGRIQVHSVIDYFPVQNQPLALPPPPIDVRVTEVMRRTQFLNSNSIKDRVLGITDSVRNVQNWSPPTSSSSIVPVNHPSFNPEPSFGGPFYQNPSLNKQTQYQTDFSYDFGTNRNGILDSEPVRKVFISEIKNQNPSPYQLSVNLQNLIRDSRTIPVRPPSPVRALSPVRVPSPERVPGADDPSDSDYESDTEYEGDGITHSLPCPRHGPYTCPRCNRVFVTSQMFAAHVGSHYKTETKAERKKRQAAKYKNKRLRLVHSDNVLTVMPQSFKVNGKGDDHGRNTADKAKLMAVKTELKDEEEVREEQGLAVPGAVKKEDLEDLPELFDVKIHPEYV